MEGYILCCNCTKFSIHGSLYMAVTATIFTLKVTDKFVVCFAYFSWPFQKLADEFIMPLLSI